MGAVSSVLNAVLRSMGFSASPCSFFRSRRQVLLRIRLGREFRPHQAQCATRACNLPQFCVKVWRADSNEISVRTFIPEINPENLRSVPSGVIDCFLCMCCIAFCTGDLLSRFLLRVFFVSLRTLSAENQLEPGSYVLSLLWC